MTNNNPSPERPSLIERLRERADKLACSVEECATSTGYPQPPEPEDDTHEYCLACATNAVSLLLLREAADALESALHRAEQAEQERDDALNQINVTKWRRHVEDMILLAAAIGPSREVE